MEGREDEGSFFLLEEEDRKATIGQWASSDVSFGQVKNFADLPFPCSFVTEKDLLAFQLGAMARKLIEEEKWAEALPPLRRLAGLRPSSFWTFYEAGRCTNESAPKGQLAGRAGRKCLLEDGERFLRRAVELAPHWPPSYAQLAKNLIAMGRGREEEIPLLVSSLLSSPHLKGVCSHHKEAETALEECLEFVKVVLLQNVK